MKEYTLVTHLILKGFDSLHDSLVLASNAGGPGFNPQPRTASYQRRYEKMVPVVPLFSTQHFKGNTGSFSRIKIEQKIKWIKSGIEIL